LVAEPTLEAAAVAPVKVTAANTATNRTAVTLIAIVIERPLHTRCLFVPPADSNQCKGVGEQVQAYLGGVGMNAAGTLKLNSYVSGSTS